VLGLVAACIDPPKFCIVMEYASRGSLLELLHDKKIVLPENIRRNMALEIGRFLEPPFLTFSAQGMNYLHSSQNIFHRDLKSSNCLVFEDWTVRISE
jgi:serine/threonine protein kinase